MPVQFEQAQSVMSLIGFTATILSSVLKGCLMANEVEPPNTRKLTDLQDHIAVKFGGIEVKISGFRITAFAIVALCLMAWMLA